MIVTGHYGAVKRNLPSAMPCTSRQKQRLYPRCRWPTRISSIRISVPGSAWICSRRRALKFSAVFIKPRSQRVAGAAADVRAPLEDKGCHVIIDAGGNDSGAKVLNQFGKYFTPEETAVLAVLNFSRYETRDVKSAIGHVHAIEDITGLTVEGVVNNTHLLRETNAEIILRGHRLCEEFCRQTGKVLWCDCYPVQLVAADELKEIAGCLMPLGLYMRPTWLDK